MSARALFQGLLKRGKNVIQNFVKNNTQIAKVKVARVDQTAPAPQQNDRIHLLWQRFVPKVSFNNFAVQYAKQASLRNGRNITLLGFMGLVVAQNQHETEDEITERLSQFVKTNESVQSPLMTQIQSLSLDLFDFGSQIGQGCNAAVYEAKLKQQPTEDLPQEVDVSVVEVSEPAERDEDSISVADSDLTILSCSDDHLEQDERAPTLFTVSYLTTSCDFEEKDLDSDNDILILSDSEDEMFEHTEYTGAGYVKFSMVDFLEEGVDVEDGETGLTSYDPGGDNLTYLSMDSTTSTGLNKDTTVPKFDLAVKMMFNYGAESNADAIMREMEKETVPARLPVASDDTNLWGNSNRVRKKRLPPHPNLVEMWGVFVDPVPHLPDGLMNYPAALPSRINPDGIGRNMTLFLVMKKYQCSLKEYVSLVHLSFRERLLLLTQLLEGVAHLGQHGIAHRDMKSDNILLDTTTAASPRLVLSDFGCCLADPDHGLQIPFPTDYIDRGGNTALMAPEIITAKPGKYSVLDYTKADVWGVGALAYEILGADNPFYSSTPTGSKLSSATYREAELPPLPAKVPDLVKSVVTQLLSRDPKMRPSARQAANLLHTILWTPDQWKYPGISVSRSEVKWWVITMATEVILETKLKKLNSPEIELKRMFVQNFNMNTYYENLKYVQEF